MILSIWKTTKKLRKTPRNLAEFFQKNSPTNPFDTLQNITTVSIPEPELPPPSAAITKKPQQRRGLADRWDPTADVCVAYGTPIEQ